VINTKSKVFKVYGTRKMGNIQKRNMVSRHLA